MIPEPETKPLTHLQRLEAEGIHIFLEVAAEAAKPAMLYSIGKDSAVMLHLARKAFYPAPPPFPLLHVDTMWKFRAMYEMRDRMAAEAGMELIVHRNPDAEAKGINPFDHGPLHTVMWKTEGLKQALDRRSEEHTSELQSLMRISYAVFCLKKKKPKHGYKLKYHTPKSH